MYNKINLQRHQEERECPNCGKTWKIWCQKRYPESYRFSQFCKECQSILTPWERKKVRRLKFPEEEQKYRDMKRKEFVKSHIKHMLHSAKTRALKRGLEFNLTKEDIIIPDKCPILEVPLMIGTKDNYEYSPSLDRIDNTKGYIRGNIQIISKKANSMKNSASLYELKMFCKNVLRYSLNSGENESVELQDKEPVG